jgi:hypothetical protein
MKGREFRRLHKISKLLKFVPLAARAFRKIPHILSPLSRSPQFLALLDRQHGTRRKTNQSLGGAAQKFKTPVKVFVGADDDKIGVEIACRLSKDLPRISTPRHEGATPGEAFP